MFSNVIIPILSLILNVSIMEIMAFLAFYNLFYLFILFDLSNSIIIFLDPEAAIVYHGRALGSYSSHLPSLPR